MVYTITGLVKGTTKEGKDFVMISTLRNSRNVNELGAISEQYFLPSYLFEGCESYIGHKALLGFKRYNEKYWLSRVTVID